MCCSASRSGSSRPAIASSAAARSSAPRSAASAVTVCAAAAGSNTGSAYAARATTSSSARRRTASGSSRRATRSSRPAATRATAVSCSGVRPGASRSASARTARSDSRWNGTSWQRERIVSGIGPSSSAASTTTAYGGGSSRSFSRESAASGFSRCASKIRYTRRSPSNGRMWRSRRSSRTSSILIWSPCGSSTYRSGCARRETRSPSLSSSPANAIAARRFPTPAGP